VPIDKTKAHFIELSPEECIDAITTELIHHASVRWFDATEAAHRAITGWSFGRPPATVKSKTVGMHGQ
jgi:hypothetical protein